MDWKQTLAICTFALGAPLVLGQSQAALPRAAAILHVGSPYQHYFDSLTRAEARRLFLPVLKKEANNSSGYFLAAMVLACKGIDIDDNTKRVLKPALVWKENSTREFKVSNGLAPDAVMLEDVPRALYLIVRTQRYLPGLRALITMPSDGAVAENQDDCIMNLLKQEPITVMKLASKEKGIYRKLVDTIDWNVGPPSDRKVFLRNLAAVRWPTAQLRRTALNLVKALRTPIHRQYSG